MLEHIINSPNLLEHRSIRYITVHSLRPQRYTTLGDYLKPVLLDARLWTQYLHNPMSCHVFYVRDTFRKDLDPDVLTVEVVALCGLVQIGLSHDT